MIHGHLGIPRCPCMIPPTDDTDVISLPQGPFASHACSCLALKLLGGMLRHSMTAIQQGYITPLMHKRTVKQDQLCLFEVAF